MSELVRNLLTLLGFVFFAALSVVCCVIDVGLGALRYVSYAVFFLSALFFALVIRMIVLFFKGGAFQQWVNELAHRTEFTARIYDDYAFRAMLGGYGSLMASSFFALTKAVAGWYYSSVWLEVLALYYLILCLTKSLVLRRGRKMVPGETPSERIEREWHIYRMCGVLLALMTLTLQGVIILIVKEGKSFSYQGTLIFVIALYDFYCLISSVVYMVRTRKKHTPVVVSLKSISFATSLVAMLTLQTAMFASSFVDEHDKEWETFMNIMTGTAVCVILCVWGILMVRRANKELKAAQHTM